MSNFKNPMPWVVVTKPGQDCEDIRQDFSNYKKAVASLREIDEDADVMRHLDDGTLTSDY